MTATSTPNAPTVAPEQHGSFPPPAPHRVVRHRTAKAFAGGVAVTTLAALGVAGWLRDTGPSASAIIEKAPAAATPAPGAPQVTANNTTATDVSKLVTSVSPGIVTIKVNQIASNTPFGGGGSQQAAGSGFVIDANGLIATNAHVVDGATSIEIGFSDGTTKAGTVTGIDHSDDLAVVKVDAKGLHALALGDSGALQVGQRVVAIGNALDLSGGPTVTEGIVSALNRSIATDSGSQLTGLIQTDAPINHGNSGGPLLDLSGKVVGINSAGADGAQNVGFAIAISPAKTLLDQLAKGQTISRAFLGVNLTDVTAELAQQYSLPVDHGVLITAVTPGSPADNAGLQRGDVITAADGKPVTDSATLGSQIKSTGAGNKLTVEIHRGSATQTVTATLTSRTA